ncbi:TetR/AcrR family transcriptional regulator [Rhodobacter sp. KR11]|uniref:TetR/AcrR family transcriptional regulator n=1 Tax=Rhodobacter sp. KR11 TaxID=2974588 RepID=UPI002222BE99|nr:TetR/AcrR family transcriptional regulator [Rhodobacter sp. KR11]MCW1920609.1 TetR/AcrR family transcriptional regulator [Rhodobacter sp. KR11]
MRDRLIEAGMTLLERDGIAGMSLRKTAALAGVSHAAPAHHFDGLPGLMTAIAEAAFARFVRAMEAAIARAPADPVSRLQATCAGYLDFATRHAGLFHVMFQSDAVSHDDPALVMQSARAYDLLRLACAPFSAQRDQAFETAVWSLVHGYALLGFAPRLGQQQGQLRIPAFSACLSHLIAEKSSRAGLAPLAPPDAGR